jgi:hypothetical protein
MHGINKVKSLVDDKPTWRTKFLKYIYLSTTLYIFWITFKNEQ